MKSIDSLRIKAEKYYERKLRTFRVGFSDYHNLGRFITLDYAFDLFKRNVFFKNKMIGKNFGEYCDFLKKEVGVRIA